MSKAPNMPGVYSLQVTRNERIASGVAGIAVALGDSLFSAKPGQFMHIKCGEGLLLRRPVSICTASQSEIFFVIETKGAGTQWLSERKPGDILDVFGPLGRGFDIPGSGFIVAGGGVGAAPLLFAAQAAAGKATAVLGFRSVKNVILEKEFAAACDKVLIATEDGSTGVKGTVTGPLDTLIRSGAYAGVLACGPRPMLAAVAKTCGRRGVDCMVSLEERMGCAIGACMVCSCRTHADGAERMSRVCKDGPVFNATEIVW
ncbi:MAG: dihydroorotate dehydrogenase electron transfer subunit [Oscillospiraceae bacterium]|nr:dihydroorotate dehydrogenase electron transfer subunit [Oscillospiraceae bacterium]